MPSRISAGFNRFAQAVSRLAGQPVVFAIAVLIVLVWAASGPFFDFSDTWQLVINTGATLATTLMVFLIQNTQNRHSAAIQIKLAELIRSVEGAHNTLVDLEKLDQAQLEAIRASYEKLAEDARVRRQKGHRDTGVPETEPVPSE